MDRIEYDKRLSKLIVEFSENSISKDRADLIVFRYVCNSPKRYWWTPNHYSISQVANNVILVEQMKREEQEEKGREEVSKSIQDYLESYAENRELVGFIEGCVVCKATLKEVIEKVKKNYENVTEEKIVAIYNSVISQTNKKK